MGQKTTKQPKVEIVEPPRLGKLPDRDVDLDSVKWDQSQEKFVSHKTLSVSNPPIDVLRIITYNVWFESLAFDQRAEALFKIFQDSNPHIICLQEVTPRFLKLLTENSWIKSNYFFTDVSGVSVNSYGVLILSQFQVEATKSYVLDTLMDRRALIIDLLINGEKTTVCTVHLESIGKYFKVRAAQLETIWKLLNKRKSSSIFFMGDFNFCPIANPTEEKNIDTSYKDAWTEIHGDAPGATIGPNYPDPQWEPARFDRMLFKSKTWTASTVELLGATALSPNVFPSDHLGILTTFNKS